ncbi:MAG: hypothetical protein ACVCEJ_06930 [Candidatus Izemoplasmataceae bacterium]
MIFAFFHLFGLAFLVWFYKIKIHFINYLLIFGIFTLYYFTLQDASLLAMLIYSWAIYYINTYILTRNFHTSYHISITVIIVGLFANTLIAQDGFHYYQYMFGFSLEHVFIMSLQLGLMFMVLLIRKRLSFYKDTLYASRFTYINLFMHFQIVMIHFIRDINFVKRYTIDTDMYYYQSIFYTSFVFYLMLILSAIFYENKRATERKLFEELKIKQDDLRHLFDTKPSKLIHQMKELASNGEFDKVLEETHKYMGYRKKVSHKRVLDKLEDDLLAYVTMEVISKEKNVAFEVVVECEPKVILSKLHYFLEMYGIILDNAVDAAKKANLRYVKIVFDEDKVIVENSYVKEDVDQLIERNSLKGLTRRINGLKLLDYLEQESNINVNVEVSYRVIVSLEVNDA